MINRILIRIKVVQMLYSYLLVQKDFQIESQPTPPTKEKRFAYELYLNYLKLMMDISRRIEKRGGQQPLRETRFIATLEHLDQMQSAVTRLNNDGAAFDGLEAQLADKIKESALYKNYLKNAESNLNADVDVWKEIFTRIIAKDSSIARRTEEMANYSRSGTERAEELIETTFTNFYSANAPIKDALKTLSHSLEKARELYFRLLRLPIDLADLRERQLDDARNKYLPTDEDRNPNLRFVENQLVDALRHDPEIERYSNQYKLNWMSEKPEMLASLLKEIMKSEIYQEYMEMPVSDFHSDCEFWRSLFKQIIFNNDFLLDELENMSVFWNDDFDIIGTFVLKTFKRFDEATGHGSETAGKEAEEPVLPMYKDSEDARFGIDLMNAAIKNREQYRELIDEHINTANWDAKRLAFMDVVVMQTAIAELLNFPKIPTSVTVNEYIEMAKSYSTYNSGSFVHGMLGSIIAKLREDGKLQKP